MRRSRGKTQSEIAKEYEIHPVMAGKWKNELLQRMPDLFDLVITDQTMPGMTGTGIARKMIQIRADMPVILCTGYSPVISEEKAKSMGIKEFAFKPLSKKDIAVLIRKDFG